MIQFLRLERRPMEQSGFIGGNVKNSKLNILSQAIPIISTSLNKYVKQIHEQHCQWLTVNHCQCLPQVHLGKYAREGVVLDR